MSKKITIEIKGGLVQDVHFPFGLKDVIIVIKDYDITSIEEGRTKEDENGYFEESEYRNE